MPSWWENGSPRRKTVLALIGLVCIGGAIVNGGLGKGDNMASIVMGVLGLVAILGLIDVPSAGPSIADLEDRLRETGLDYWQQEIRHRGLQRRLFIPPALTVLTADGAAEQPVRLGGAAWTQVDFARKIGKVLVQEGVRRAVIYGRGGSGKSLLAMMGMIGMLEQRNALVPLLLSLNSWRSTESFESWINRVLVSTYPAARLLAADGDGSRAGRLVRSGRFMIVLDGFDELPQAFQQEALRQINAFAPPPDPLVILTRQWTTDCSDRLAIDEVVHIGIVDLDPERVANYLRVLDDPALHRLADLEEPEAKILTRPLYLELAVDAVRAGEVSVEDLELVIRRGGARGGESYLLELKIRQTLDRPGVPGGRGARRWLEYIATQMGRKDVGAFAWFHTIGWVPSSVMSVSAALSLIPGYMIALLMPVGLTRGLALGLVAGTGFGIMRGVRPGVVAAVCAFAGAWTAVAAVGLMSVPVTQMLVDATEIALTAGMATLLKERLLARPAAGTPRWKPYATAIGLVLAIGVGIAAATKGIGLSLGFDDPNRDFPAIVVAVVSGLGVAVGASRILIHDPLRAQPSSLVLTTRARQGGVFRHLRSGLISATAIGIAGGLGGALRFGFDYGWALIIIFGVAIGIPVGIVGGVIKWLSAPPLTGRYSDHSPMRTDRLTAVGIIVAVSAAAAGGVATLTGPPITALNETLQSHSGSTLHIAPVHGILFGLTIGVVVACYNSAWPAFVVSHVYLAAHRRLPWRLFSLLEALHHHQLLRREGLHYQFRNIEMQDHLAGRSRPLG